jgi:tRNA pseudouridine13 synthase
MDPFELSVVPRLSPLPPVRGTFGAREEDFVVEEILAYAPEGRGNHLYLFIEKRGITTFEAVRRLARFLDRPTHDFGMAGLKDAQAVTRQWLSIEGVAPERLRGWTIGGVAVLDAVPHRHKLRIGHARGNRFFVRITNVSTEDAARTRAITGELLKRGLPNAYGPQRFGRESGTLRAGLALVRGDLDGFAACNRGRPAEATERRLRSLMISAVQSELFNRVLARRMPGIDRLEDGDVAFIHRNGAAFVVESAAAEQPRADAFEISPSGPMPGMKLLQGGGRPRRIEEEVFAEAGLGCEAFANLPLGHRAAGARRPLRVPVGDFELRDLSDCLEFRFSLPGGSYATRFIYELLGSPVAHDPA